MWGTIGSTVNISEERLILKYYLNENELYLSKIYFILHTKCENNGRQGNEPNVEPNMKDLIIM